MTFEIYALPDDNEVERLMNILERKKEPYTFKSAAIEENMVFLYEAGIADELPAVFKDDHYIGGFDETIHYLNMVVSIDSWKRLHK